MEAQEQTGGERRRFIELMGGGAAAVALSGLLSACGNTADQSDTTAEQPTRTGAKQPTAASQTQAKGDPKGDLAIVQYALTLEHVESAFYARVVRDNVFKSGRKSEVFKRIDRNEKMHVEALTATLRKLGGTVAEEPRTSFDKVLEGGPDKVLSTAATLENVGAAAYLGQAARIQSREVLAAALSIHTVEARHAATLNELAGRGFDGKGSLRGSVPDDAFAKPLSRPRALAHLQELFA